MSRRVVGLLAALVLAGLGTLALVRYVEAARERAVAGGTLVPALVVTQPVAQGTPASQLGELVETVNVPTGVRPADALTTLQQVDGQVTAVDLVAGEQLLASRFIDPEVLEPPKVPPDKLRVTLSLDPQRSVGGRLRVGDNVAVLATFDGSGEGGDETSLNRTHIILHKVVVAAVQAGADASGNRARQQEEEGADPDATQPAPSGALLITLALDAPAVERVVFAAEHGRVWLAAEPLEASEEGTKIVTPENVYE